MSAKSASRLPTVQGVIDLVDDGPHCGDPFPIPLVERGSRVGLVPSDLPRSDGVGLGPLFRSGKQFRQVGVVLVVGHRLSIAIAQSFRHAAAGTA